MAAEPTTDNVGDTLMAELSPRQQAPQRFDDASPRQIRKTMATFEEHRSDPDAQTTVTDFLDFTEYLPSDIIRSLTLIEKHDLHYVDASSQVYELTKTWGQLPTLQPNERPSPIQLRADISEHLNQAVSSRVFAHAESLRMSESVNRHYNKAKLLLSKLQAMMDNYPSDKQQALSPVMSRSPQLSRAKLPGRSGEDGEQKVRQKRMPKIMVPGEVLAPYDIEYDTFTDGSDVSTDDDDDVPATIRKNITATPRIKLVSSTPRSHKSSHRSTRPASHTTPASAEAVAAQAAALLNPPPENAVIGSADAPWLQLTEYELAKLRKRMKKNATWTPSETMVARELRALGRGPEDYKEAKRKAEEEGVAFEAQVPAAAVSDDGSGSQQLPAGAISVDSAAVDELPMSNRGMKLNEAKKMKREALAKQAAEEAEESARKMAEAAKLLLGSNGTPSGGPSESPKESGAKSAKTRANSRSNAKRKRETELKVESEPPEGADSPSRPVLKRTKTETPVPPPVPATPGQTSAHTSEPPAPQAQSQTQSQSGQSASGSQAGIHVETPVPIPMPPQASSNRSTPGPTKTPSSPPPAESVIQADISSVSLKPPAAETSVPTTRSGRRKSNTPVPPPQRELPSREVSRRETRGGAAKRLQQQPQTPTESPLPSHEIQLPTVEQRSRRSVSRGTTPGKGSDGNHGRRPMSRGKSVGQESQISLAADRPRRASTARNTPAPESRPPGKRAKRPAPGIVSITRSGGNSAVGKRKAAPRKKPRTRKEKDQQEVEEEDVDDEGNPIDPNEPRYCNCNRVSFGTMIQCDNIEGCKGEWFHLECVGLEDIPARTTKWYCPDCRRVLNIGERGEVSARGVRK